jgi:hypothetical protein
MRKEIFSLSAATLEILTNLQEERRSPDISLSTGVVKEIRSVVIRFIEFHMEREIKSAAFLHQFSLA